MRNSNSIQPYRKAKNHADIYNWLKDICVCHVCS